MATIYGALSMSQTLVVKTLCGLAIFYFTQQHYIGSNILWKGN